MDIPPIPAKFAALSMAQVLRKIDFTIDRSTNPPQYFMKPSDWLGHRKWHLVESCHINYIAFDVDTDEWLLIPSITTDDGGYDIASVCIGEDSLDVEGHHWWSTKEGADAEVARLNKLEAEALAAKRNNEQEAP